MLMVILECTDNKPSYASTLQVVMRDVSSISQSSLEGHTLVKMTAVS